MVLREDLLPDLPDHVVPLDLPAVADRPVTEPGMEIPAAHQYVQLTAGYGDGDIGMAFLGKLRDVSSEWRVGVTMEMV